MKKFAMLSVIIMLVPGVLFASPRSCCGDFEETTPAICLTLGTSIDTPDGQFPVESLEQGMQVWSVDGGGKRIPVSILRTSKARVPSNFEVVVIVLQDGRTLSASPSHPSATGIPLVQYSVGDLMDGSNVVSIELKPYTEMFTYDILPDGETGLYWAAGIKLQSTLVK